MEFKTKLRFSVMSDVHYSSEKLYVRDYFRSAMEKIYAYCAEEEYKNLDALYVVGDFTDRGLREQMEMFREDCEKYVNPDTKLVITLANHELHYVDDYRESMANFKEIFNMDFDRHEVIGGYHFISMSTTFDKGPWHDSFDEPKREFLKAELEKAREDGGNRPIFVFQHVGMTGTVYGGVYGNSELYPILSGYPQVIDFSGHSHFATNDPREINQCHFTSVSTGSLMNISACGKQVNPHISGSVIRDGRSAHMLVVEVDEDSTVRIRRLDVVANDFFENDSYIKDAHDRAKYQYTMKRAARAHEPYFAKSAKAEIYREGEQMIASFPRALCEGERVYEYDIRILDEKETVIFQKSVTSDFYHLHQADCYSVIMEDIPGAASGLIYAIGFWDNCSEPIPADIAKGKEDYEYS